MLCLVLTNCKKDKAQLETLYFEGQLIEHTTSKTIAGEKVYLVYGEACCGGIEKVKGADSTVTDANGHYFLSTTYEKDTVLYRHMVYPNAYGLRFRPLPPVAITPSLWHMFDYVGPYAVPESITDTLLNGRTTTTDFVMIQSGFLRVSYSLQAVPFDRNLHISIKGKKSEYSFF